MTTAFFATPDSPDVVVIPAGITDLRSFRDWTHSDDFPRQGSVSYVAGEIIVDMSPEEIDTHNRLKGQLYMELFPFVEDAGVGDLFTDGMMFVNEAADVSTEPDGIVCTREGLDAGRVAYREHSEGSGRLVEIVGSPDIVIEVISRSSVHKDTVVLFESYFAAGVREYWWIDARGETIEFRIHRRGDHEFVANEPDAEGYVRSDVLARNFLPTRHRTPTGRWRYRLLGR
ncbi:MAG: Uma2 family endonuclease [Planctomycetaceae bacterium]